MAKKVTKKVDVKKVVKLEVSVKVAEFLESIGISVEQGTDYGFTEGTLVAHLEKADVQIKLITPKAGIDRYQKLEDEEDEE